MNAEVCQPNERCLEVCPVVRHEREVLGAVEGGSSYVVEEGMHALDEAEKALDPSSKESLEERARSSAENLEKNERTAEHVVNSIVDLTTHCEGPQRKLTPGRVLTGEIYVCQSTSPQLQIPSLRAANQTFGEVVVDEVRQMFRRPKQQ